MFFNVGSQGLGGSTLDSQARGSNVQGTEIFSVETVQGTTGEKQGDIFTDAVLRDTSGSPQEGKDGCQQNGRKTAHC